MCRFVCGLAHDLGVPDKRAVEIVHGQVAAECREALIAAGGWRFLGPYLAVLCCGHAVLCLRNLRTVCRAWASGPCAMLAGPAHAHIEHFPDFLSPPPLAEAAYRSGNQPDLLLALYRLSGALDAFPLPHGSAQAEMVGRQVAQTMDLELRKQVGMLAAACCGWAGKCRRGGDKCGCGCCYGVVWTVTWPVVTCCACTQPATDLPATLAPCLQIFLEFGAVSPPLAALVSLPARPGGTQHCLLLKVWQCRVDERQR